MRDSSWPEAQREWKASGRRCSWAYIWTRMSVSTPSVALETIQRRMNISSASPTPTATATAPSAYRPGRSDEAIGPSITRRVTSGTRMLAPMPSTETTSMTTKRQR